MKHKTLRERAEAALKRHGGGKDSLWPDESKRIWVVGWEYGYLAGTTKKRTITQIMQDRESKRLKKVMDRLNAQIDIHFKLLKLAGYSAVRREQGRRKP